MFGCFFYSPRVCRTILPTRITGSNRQREIQPNSAFQLCSATPRYEYDQSVLAVSLIRHARAVFRSLRVNCRKRYLVPIPPVGPAA